METPAGGKGGHKMKCSDCDNLGWVSDEGEQVWGWCWYSRSCPDPDIDRNCPNFALKKQSMLQRLKTENENLRAEMKRMEACIYYKAGGFCRYGGDDPANVCVLGPCNHEVAAQKFIAEAVAEKGDRDHPAPPEPLTQEQLQKMDGPVWVACKPIEGGNGYWCLCQRGHIITPAGSIFDVKEIPHWVFYRRPPEGEEDINV